jgi:hypothetical protein
VAPSGKRIALLERGGNQSLEPEICSSKILRNEAPPRVTCSMVGRRISERRMPALRYSPGRPG